MQNPKNFFCDSLLEDPRFLSEWLLIKKCIRRTFKQFMVNTSYFCDDITDAFFKNL